jgi:hypothetical protein
MRTVSWTVGNGTPTIISIADNATPAEVRVAIQAALDAAAQAAQARGEPATVTLSAGEFIVDGTGAASQGGVGIGSNVTFQGTIAGGVKQTTIKLDDAYDSTDVTGIVRTKSQPGIHDVTIRDLVIEGNGAAASNKVDGIYAGYMPPAGAPPAPHADITIDNVDVSNVSRYGIDPHEQLTNLTIRNSAAHGNGVDGFTLDYIEGGVIENCVAYDNGRHGFNVVTGSRDLVMRDNVAYGNDGNGLVVQPPSQSDDRGLYSYNIAVIGGEFHGNGETGIKINSAKDVTIEGAYVHHNVQHGIRVGISTWNPSLLPFPPPSTERVVIAGNRVENNGGTGGGDAEIDLKSEHGVSIGVSVYGNRIGVVGSPAQYDIKATANVTASVDGNRYGDGTPSVTGLSILDDPAAIGASTLVSLTSGADNHTSGAGRQHIEGLAGNDTIAAGAGIDTLLGGGGDDCLDGGADKDFLIGGDGNDMLNGSTGADWMHGGAGNDIFVIDNAGDIVFELANAGIDTVQSAITFSLLSLPNFENLTLTGSATIHATGNQYANILAGNAAGNRLSSGSGADTLSGGGGNDRLIGGNGKDTMTGGAGSDIFDFNAILESGLGAARDIVTDFSQVAGNDDVIDLLGIDAEAGVAGDQAFTWLGTGALTGAAQLRYFQSGGVTVIQGSTDADTDAEFEIELAGLKTLAAGDFLL